MCLFVVVCFKANYQIVINLNTDTNIYFISMLLLFFLFTLFEVNYIALKTKRLFTEIIVPPHDEDGL